MLALGGALALLVGLPWLVWRGPYLLDKGYIKTSTVGEAGGSAALITGLRTALVACAAAIGAGVALVYTIRNYRLTRRGQVTDRFTKALERLGSNHRYVRIGGVLALEQIVQDAPEQATHAAQVLGHFVRDRAPARPGPSNAPDGEATTTDTSLPTSPEADIQVALTALTRPESRTHVDDRERLDLGNLHLAGASLVGADLTGASLVRADLTGVVLAGADLAGVVLVGADLKGAHLPYADLTGAHLPYANLTRASLVEANLTRADLAEANLTRADLAEANLTRADLAGANLTRASLVEANLTGADLAEANLTGADLAEADLTRAKLGGANLADVRGLRTEQVRSARITAETVLPPDIRTARGPSTT
ncbi:pentapeptide repeat-containing protein [Streptomyces sp. NPDC046881]|uniref:pentapeptide repeat-containing protein n=1 Tax=Streptomyces sp. NPDC046881 TaxID=3155374 RepID=UPI00340BFF73